MKSTVRTNPKTNKTEYKVRYYWKQADGTLRDSNTGWFSTEKQAFENAMTLKAQKELLSLQNKQMNNNKTIVKAWREWMDELEAKAYRNTTDNTTSDVTRFQRARTIFNFYMPDDIKNIRAREVDLTTFRVWMEYLNQCKQSKTMFKSKEDQKELSGTVVREFRTMLCMFNRYLGGNGYYSDNELEMNIDNMLSRTRLKPKKFGKRERYCPTVSDVRKIFDHYEANCIEDFTQFYWYTLFMVLFYSGLRPEEIIGLKWKHVHFDSKHPYIDVCNAISEREKKDNVKRRMNESIYHMKNNNSEREVPMLEYYYDVFESYRYRMKDQFNLSDFGNYYCFPNINAKNINERLTDYQKQKNILRELNRVCAYEGIPKTDVQMFRHACATWLVTDKDHGGMGFEESRARDYFGHTSDEMLRSVYAKLDKKQRANRTSATFSNISKQHAEERLPKDVIKSIEINKKINDVVENSEDKFDSIYNRLSAEIFKAINDGEKEYQYLLKDVATILFIQYEWKEKGRDLEKEIKFVQRKTSMDEIWKEDNKRLREKLKKL